MFGMMRGALIKNGKAADEGEAWEMFFKEYIKDIKEQGYLDEDGVGHFKTNRAFIAHAIV